MIKPKFFYFRCDPYCTDISVFFAYAPSKLLSEVKKVIALTKNDEYAISDSVKHCDAFCFTTGRGFTFFYFSRKLLKKHLSQLAGIVAHEAVHAASKILSSRDIPPCKQTEEVYAYLQGYIVTETMKGILQ
jgi:hypothetical protein